MIMWWVPLVTAAASKLSAKNKQNALDWTGVEDLQNTELNTGYQGDAATPLINEQRGDR